MRIPKLPKSKNPQPKRKLVQIRPSLTAAEVEGAVASALAQVHDAIVVIEEEDVIANPKLRMDAAYAALVVAAQEYGPISVAIARQHRATYCPAHKFLQDAFKAFFEPWKKLAQRSVVEGLEEKDPVFVSAFRGLLDFNRAVHTILHVDSTDEQRKVLVEDLEAEWASI